MVLFSLMKGLFKLKLSVIVKLFLKDYAFDFVQIGPRLTSGALVEDNDILVSIINILIALISLKEGLFDLKLGVSQGLLYGVLE